MPESNLQTKTIDFFNAKPNTMAINNHGSVYSGRGWPDVLVLTHGLAFYIETKRKGGEARKSQRIRHKEILKKSMVRTFIIDRFEDLEEIWADIYTTVEQVDAAIKLKFGVGWIDG